MRILHLRASNFYGGPERQLHLHAREALGSSYVITVASFSEDRQRPEFLDRIARDEIDTHAFDVSSGYDPRAVPALRGYIRDHGIDLVCTHEYRTTILGWLATIRSDAVWIAFSRGFTTENLKIRVYHGFDKLLIRKAAHIVAVSVAQKRKLEHLRIPGSRISAVPNAIDPVRIATDPAIDLRERFGFGAGDFICVAGGRFSREKGQVFLVEAAARALQQKPHIRFVLFGDGPELASLRDRVTSLGLGAQVICPGFEEEMSGCLRGADLLINPSLSEGMPNIVLEAMALGVPVVATAVGGVPEIIEDGLTGRLVEAADSGALADAILQAARNPGESARMAGRAQEYVSAELSFSHQFEQLREIYDREFTRRG